MYFLLHQSFGELMELHLPSLPFCFITKAQIRIQQEERLNAHTRVIQSL